MQTQSIYISAQFYVTDTHHTTYTTLHYRESRYACIPFSSTQFQSFMRMHTKGAQQHTTCVMNRQARVVLEDRMKYSLQLTALRLNPRRLRGVQALTMHYP